MYDSNETFVHWSDSVEPTRATFVKQIEFINKNVNLYEVGEGFEL